jgi:neutral ceramidase
MSVNLKAGASKIDITPPENMALAGFRARHGISVGIHDRLYSSVLILDDGTEKFLLICNDLIGLDSEFTSELKKLIAAESKIPFGRIMLTCTHTHSGPLTVNASYGRKNELYLSFLKGKILKAVRNAVSNLKGAFLSTGSITIKNVGKNRRLPDTGSVDPILGIIKIKQKNNKLLVVLANYCCHPTVLGPDNLLISADYPGSFRDDLEKRFGSDTVIMFTNGACGDINPGHSAEISALGGRIPGRTFKRASEVGGILAAATGKIISGNSQKEVSLAIKSKKIDLLLKNFPSVEKIKSAIAENKAAISGKKGKELLTAQVELLHSELLLGKAVERNAIDDDYLTFAIQAVKISGDTVLLGMPAELFVDIGLSIKKMSPFKNTFVIGYANGYMGYVPTQKAFEEGGYEVLVAKFTPKSSEKIIKTSLNILNEIVA